MGKALYSQVYVILMLLLGSHICLIKKDKYNYYVCPTLSENG